ncbi:MAG: hypothetical protein WBP12_03125 [Candidatus Saccharimonas sp.]
MNNKKNSTISIVGIRRLLGREEFDKKSIEEWMLWLADLELIADCMIGEITGSKYQSSIEKVERMLDNI